MEVPGWQSVFCNILRLPFYGSSTFHDFNQYCTNKKRGKDGALVGKMNSADLQVAIRNGPRFRWQLLLMGVRNNLRLAVVDSDVVVFQEHLKCHET